MNWRIPILIVVCLGVLLGAIAASGVSPVDAAMKLIDSAFGNPMKIAGTLKETTPLILAGLAVYIALKAGLFNIGVEGQIAIGGLCCAVVTLSVGGFFGLILGIVAGMAGGALWAFPAGWIRAYKGGHEVISTIMLNNIAMGLTLTLLAGPLRAPGQEGTTTKDIDAASHIPAWTPVDKLEISLALPVTILIIIAFAYWLKKSVSGYELRLTGDNPTAAQFAGVDVKKTITKAMLWSGAVGGLAGSIQVLAFEHRYFQGISSGYGFDALGVAMLSGSNPIGMLASGLLFGVLNKGSSAIQILGLPKGITWIVLGLLLVVFAAIRYRRAPAAA